MILQCLVPAFLLLHTPSTSCHPAPQTQEPDQAYDDYYGDYDVDSKAATPTGDNGLLDLLKTGSSLAQGILALLGEKDLRDRVGSTISTGVNLTGQIARVAVPLVTSVAEQVPALINSSRTVLQTLNSEENQQRLRQVAGAGNRVAQGVGVVASQVGFSNL